MDMFETRTETNSLLQQETIADHQGYLAVKRLLDIVLSLLALLLLTPLFLTVAAAIKLEDPRGPVLFRQIRIGKNGKPFAMYKFRSMVTNAESILEELLPHNEIEGAMFKMKEDPRVTRVGRLLRRWSIDEFPQFWNVLSGEMTLVGPRPPLPREVKDYTSYELQRLSVTPGCTGLWQVSGRNALSFYEMVELDLQYIARRGLRMDMMILWRTFKMLLLTKNGL